MTSSTIGRWAEQRLTCVACCYSICHPTSGISRDDTDPSDGAAALALSRQKQMLKSQLRSMRKFDGFVKYCCCDIISAQLCKSMLSAVTCRC